MPEVLVDGSLVGLRFVGHDDLDLAAPAWALLDEETGERAAALRCSTMARICPVSPSCKTVT